MRVKYVSDTQQKYRCSIYNISITKRFDVNLYKRVTDLEKYLNMMKMLTEYCLHCTQATYLDVMELIMTSRLTFTHQQVVAAY
jgi:hypothetical protein